MSSVGSSPRLRGCTCFSVMSRVGLVARTRLLKLSKMRRKQRVASLATPLFISTRQSLSDEGAMGSQRTSTALGFCLVLAGGSATHTTAPSPHVVKHMLQTTQ